MALRVVLQPVCHLVRGHSQFERNPGANRYYALAPSIGDINFLRRPPGWRV